MRVSNLSKSPWDLERFSQRLETLHVSRQNGIIAPVPEVPLGPLCRREMWVTIYSMCFEDRTHLHQPNLNEFYKAALRVARRLFRGRAKLKPMVFTWSSCKVEILHEFISNNVLFPSFYWDLDADDCGYHSNHFKQEITNIYLFSRLSGWDSMTNCIFTGEDQVEREATAHAVLHELVIIP